MDHFDTTHSRDEADDPETETYTTDHDWDAQDAPSQAIIDAVATVTGSDPLQLRPLYEVVDLDSLGRLFQPGRSGDAHQANRSVRFQYEGCEVTVDAAGQTRVRATDACRK